MSAQPVVATVVQDTTLIGVLGNLMTITYFLEKVFGHKSIVNCFSFVIDLLSSDVTAFLLFVVSFMTALAVYFTNITRNSYAYKLPLLLASVFYIVYRNSIMKYTGDGSGDIGNVAYALTATMAPTLFYGNQTRYAPCNWMVLFHDTKCHHKNELKLFRFDIYNNCIYSAVEQMGMHAVDKEHSEISLLEALLVVPEKTDYEYGTAMGYYIMSMQRHILCGYFGYLLGWVVFVAVEVYNTCMECQKDSKIDPKERNKVTWSRVLENVWALWQWDVEAKRVHQMEFKFTSCMVFSIALTWAWVQMNIVREPDVATRAMWFSDLDHWHYTMFRLVVSDPFFWFLLFHVRFLVDMGFKVWSWVNCILSLVNNVWFLVYLVCSMVYFVSIGIFRRRVIPEEDDGDDPLDLDYLPPSWMHEEAYVDAHEEGRLQGMNQYDTYDDDYEQHYLDIDVESDPDEWKGEDESLDW